MDLSELAGPWSDYDIDRLNPPRPEILDAAQYETYRTWEQKQVESFRQRGLWSGGQRARRGGR